MHRQRSSRRAFTLLELMISITLIMFMMLMIQQMFNSAQRLYRIAAERAQVLSQARAVFDEIERDIQRLDMSIGDLIMLGKAPENELEAEDYRRLYFDRAFELEPDNQSTTDIEPLLAFSTTTSWYSTTKKKRVSGPAQVIYYLRKRPDRRLPTGDTYKPVSAYLMRRIIPRVLRVVDKPEDLDVPPEEEIAGSVLDCRLHAVNNAAAPYIAQSGRPAEIFSALNDDPTRHGKLLQDMKLPGVPPPTTSGGSSGTGGGGGTTGSGSGGAAAGPTFFSLSPTGSRPGKTYSFGPTAGSIVENLRTRGGPPVAIALEITFVDENFDIDGGSVYGTIRRFSRVFAIPGAQSPTHLDEKEMSKFPRA